MSFLVIQTFYVVYFSIIFWPLFQLLYTVKGLCKVLNLAGKKHETTKRGELMNVYFNSNNFWINIRTKLDHQGLLDFKSNMYRWTLDIATNNDLVRTYNEIKTYIGTDLASLYEFEISGDVLAFLPDHYTARAINNVAIVTDEPHNIDIEVCSVHSAKGQTHCATMYVETSYHNYESQKKYVKHALKQNEHQFNLSNNLDVRGKEAFKMMYVGFSRPTHLLCFAVLKDNISMQEITNMEQSGWIIIDLTNE